MKKSDKVYSAAALLFFIALCVMSTTNKPVVAMAIAGVAIVLTCAGLIIYEEEQHADFV